ncbi:transglutaminase domain-containing protein [Sphaerisporangium rhizosphaerae]|uniref:transglutaminase domain-containing protein n=1 Tax=Sphaerisporangium rhizosphaerae TaxID=2269375 RepID=UPI0036D26FF3
MGDLVERLARVPGRYRRFVATREDATWRHGIGPEMLDALTSAGMPCERVDGATRYDELDLVNVSLSLRLPSPRLMVMRGWAAAIRATAHAGPTTYTVTINAHCRHSTPDEPCSIEASTELRGNLAVSAPRGGPLTLTRHVTAGEPRAYPDLAPFFGLIDGVRFHLLPNGLREDVGFLRETGLADCRLAAAHLVEEAASRGLLARRSFGLFLSAPYSISHSWLDLRLDDRWVSFDPLLLNLFTGWGLLAADQWPAHRSTGDGACRLGEREFVLATHNGEALPLSFPTEILDTERRP